MADNKSIADELLKLHELKEKGVITEEEFNEQKARLLHRSKDQSDVPPSQVGTERVESQSPLEQPTVIVTQTKAPGSSGLLGCLGGGVVAVVVVVVLLAIGGYFWFSSHKGTDEEATSSSNQQHETVAITSAQLAAAYSENEVAAKQTYGDKTLDVTGTITGINLDLFDNPVVDLEGVNEFLSVQASFDKSYNARIGALSKGQQITVRCTSLDSVLTTPMLKDCSLPSSDETVSPPETNQAPPEAAPVPQPEQVPLQTAPDTQPSQPDSTNQDATTGAMNSQLVAIGQTMRSAAATLSECMSAVTSDSQYAPLAQHVPLATNQWSPTQLTDDTFATDDEIELARSLHQRSVGCDNAYLNEVLRVMPTLVPIWQSALAAKDRETDGLAQRQITWGQFAQDEKDINDQLQQNLTAEERRIVTQLR